MSEIKSRKLSDYKSCNFKVEDKQITLLVPLPAEEEELNPTEYSVLINCLDIIRMSGVSSIVRKRTDGSDTDVNITDTKSIIEDSVDNEMLLGMIKVGTRLCIPLAAVQHVVCEELQTTIGKLLCSNIFDMEYVLEEFKKNITEDETLKNKCASLTKENNAKNKQILELQEELTKLAKKPGLLEHLFDLINEKGITMTFSPHNGKVTELGSIQYE